MDRLERENLSLRRGLRLLTGIVLSAMLAATVLLVGGAEKSSRDLGVVEANRVVLKDNGGRQRCVLRIEDNGDVSQEFTDTKGKARLIMGVSGGLPSVEFLQAEDKAHLSLGAEANGTVGMQLYGKDGDKPRVDISVQADDAPVVSLIDRNGRQRVGLHVDPEDKETLILMKKDGTVSYIAPRR
jgi:hypothetical protein